MKQFCVRLIFSNFINIYKVIYNFTNVYKVVHFVHICLCCFEFNKNILYIVSSVLQNVTEIDYISEINVLFKDRAMEEVKSSYNRYSHFYNFSYFSINAYNIEIIEIIPAEKTKYAIMSTGNNKNVLSNCQG